MSRIQTLRHPQHSIFQALVEDVACRIESLKGTRDPSEKGAPRLDEDHPAAAVGYAVASAVHAGEKVPKQPPEAVVKKHGDAATSLWDCARLTAEIVGAKFRGDFAAAQKKEAELKFGTCDPEWAEAVIDYEKFFGPEGGRREIPYVRPESMDDFVLETLPPDATVALIGDWGTGTDEAIALLEQVKAHEPDVVIHLGDVYYAGTPTENRKFFLDVLNRVLERDKKPVAVYNLAGNHDMYSGGVGYYGLLPELNPAPLFRPEQAQKASYFCLRSTDGAWQFLGMDTGLHDHDPFAVSTDVTRLEPDEEAWHADKIRRHSRAGGRTILLSHHQLFSAFEEIGKGLDKPPGEEAANPHLLSSLRAFQAAAAEGTGDVAAWFWGHEHNLEVYEPHLGLDKGRCMGHGAIPHFADENPYQTVASFENPPRLVDDPRKPGQKLMLDTVDQTYAHGFVIVRLDDATRTAAASYYQETDLTAPMYEETL